MTDTIEIVISSPDHGYTWDAWLGDEHLGRFDEPLFEACRLLMKCGVDPATRIATRHAGQPYRSLSTTVGRGAKMTVVDKPSKPPHFGKYESPEAIAARANRRQFELNNNEVGSEPVVEREPVEGTQTAAEPFALNGGGSLDTARPSYEPG